LIMLRISAPAQRSALRNYPSWEKADGAKRALGPAIAKVARTRRVGVRLVNRPHAECAATVWGSTQGHDFLLSAHHGRHGTTRQEAVLGPGSHVHDRRSAQQHPQPMRSCCLNRHLGAHHLSFPAGYGGEPRRTKRPRSPRALPVSPMRRQGWTSWSADATLPRRLRPGPERLRDRRLSHGI